MRDDLNKNNNEETNIHSTAMIDRGAELGVGCYVGPYCSIGPKVKLGDGVRVEQGGIVSGRTTIGERTQISPYSTIGSLPQDLKYHGEDSELIIGTDNLIREYSNISLGTEGGGGVTRIGNHNLFMVYTHIAHDCIIGNHSIFANAVQVAGHVEVGDGAVFGGTAGIHQFVRIGELAMMAAGTIVVQDVPPYCTVQGDRAVINGLNVVGLKRKKLKQEHMTQLKSMYRLVFSENLTMETAITEIETAVPDSAYRHRFLEFLRASTRGICR
jgi:UDP-N-acetylglucosamine acyltransferase